MSEQVYVIELNQNNADIVYTNGHYTGRASEGVTMDDGDQFGLRLASIDSQKSDSQSIVLSEDTPISFQFSYYENNYDITDKQALDRSGAYATEPDFRIYACYAERDIERLTSVQFKCPSYVPGGPIPNNVNVFPLFSWVDPSGVHQQNSGKILEDPFQYEGSATGSAGKGVATCTANSHRITYQSGTLSVIGFKAFQGIAPVNPTTDVKFIPGSIVFTTVSTGKRNLEMGTAGVTIPSGRYDRTTFAITLTKLVTTVMQDPDARKGPDKILAPNTQLVFRTDDERYETTCFTRVPDEDGDDIEFNNTTSYVYDTTTAPTAPNKPSIEVGARKFAIEWGQNGSVFQLSAAHQSVYNPSSAGKDNVGFFRTGTPGTDMDIHTVAAATGIVIHEMQPKSVWSDLLGLYDKLKVPLETDSNDVLYYQVQDLEGKIPLESETIPLYTSSNSRVVDSAPGWSPPPPAVGVRYIDTTETPTNAVLGDQPLVNLSGGYYLIEVTGINLAQSNYIDNTQNRANISAIVSRQYDSNDIITGFADSSIPYVHRGRPIKISGATVRILDPLTKEVVNGLGPNNTVFLQVIKSIDPAKKKSP